MNQNVIKLWKTILQLQSIMTDKAELIVESELVEGVEVFVEKEGEYIYAEDGEYTTEDKVIVVSEGRVSEIREKEESIEEIDNAEEVVVEPQEDDRVRELEDKVAELEKLLGEKDDKIAELEAELTAKNNILDELQMSSELPAKEAAKKAEKEGALRYFN